ncbi:VOC family protein [Guptibacillus hwajinpoensis]|uniref:VOC family protein n=1 Tax=Guptibacillus hwajinpoensis TaxID=208199 RepID=UPI001CD3B646|nr:VOC family protein [Pseudalkalibacillus hwajinpoensis]MCA0993448.1 VOC family protein [Pseudalkalibacillus hwajinpoensis]
MYRGIDHIGITVPNIEEATAFFKEAFDAKVCYDVQRPEHEPMEGKDVEKQLGLPAGKSIIHMRLLRIGEGPTLELFQLGSPADNHPARISDLGIQHFALYVDDLKAASNRFEAAGGSLLSEPHPLAGVEDGPHNGGVYGLTPWGTLLEFITYPDGIDYPEGSEAERWTPSSN